MTKGVKAALFIIIATIGNLVATAVYFLALLALYGLTLGRVLRSGTAAPAILVAFVLAVVLASVTYSKALKWLKKKYDLESRLGIK